MLNRFKNKIGPMKDFVQQNFPYSLEVSHFVHLKPISIFRKPKKIG